jgi:hypothetical protein
MHNFPVWINFHVSPEKGPELAKILGITKLEIRPPEISDLLNETRIQQMNRLGLSPRRPGFGETGRPVFGKQGLKGVRIDEHVMRLGSQGYKASSTRWIETHCRDDEGKISEKRKHVLTVVLAIPDSPETVVLSNEFFNNFVAYCGRGPWTYCHVWENPFHDVIELLGNNDERARRFNQLFMNQKGDYRIKRIEPPEKKRTA